jgi:hypothetical protein
MGGLVEIEEERMKETFAGYTMVGCVCPPTNEPETRRVTRCLPKLTGRKASSAAGGLRSVSRPLRFVQIIISPEREPVRGEQTG